MCSPAEVRSYDDETRRVATAHRGVYSAPTERGASPLRESSTFAARTVSGLVLLACFASIAPSPAIAQSRDFPQRPIRIIVPVPPGGSVDAVARVIGPKLSESLAQPVVIDNRAGASTNIGMELVARAQPDGHTLLANTIPLVANSALFGKLPFNPERDFAPISLIVNGPSIVVVHPSVAARTVAELISLAKGKPGAIKYSSSGAGTLTHLGAELFKYMARVDLAHVPYKGGGPALAAVVSGECEVSFQTPLAASGQISAGRLRALAVTGAKRLSTLADVPTVSEAGVPGYEFESWVGLLAPAATPPAVVRTLHEHVVRAARSPDVMQRFARDSAEVVASTPEAFRKQIAAEARLWARVIKEMGVKAD